MEVVFLAYAPSDTDPLPHLMKEAQFVYKTFLRKAKDRNFMPVYEPFSSISRINEMMEECRGRVSVFFYSGHAGSKEIILDGESANPKGIALYLKESVQSGCLKLVVLNGCSTIGQVNTLLTIGVPVVVATNSPVDDQAAAAFAQSFATHLCDHELCIEDAFQKALAPALSFRHDLDLTRKKLKKPEETKGHAAQEPVWEIFALEDHFARQKIIPNRNANQFRFRVGEKLLKTIFTNFLNAGNPTVVSTWKMGKGNVQDSFKETAITNSIPRPIGVQMEALLRYELNYRSKDFDPKKLFYYLTELYHCTNEFFGVIMIAQLWEVRLYGKKKGVDVSISETLKAALHEYFYLSSEERAVFDYTRLIFQIRNFLNEPTHPALIREFLKKQEIFNDFMKVDELEYTAVADKLRQFRKVACAGTWEKINLQEAYQEAEDYICELFGTLGFVYRYNLKSVHIIEAYKKRHEAVAEFRHRMFVLNQARHDENTSLVSTAYLDSHGLVIILKEQQGQPFDFLNLSPFLVDMNVFDAKSDCSMPMVFDEYNETDKYYYKEIESATGRKETYRIENEDLKDKVICEFKCFRTDLLGE